MKKYETLKAVVILQAVSMVAFAGFVMWYLWPEEVEDEEISPIHDQSKANAEDEVVAVIADNMITKQQLVDELLRLHGNQTLQNMLEHYAIKLASNDYNIVVTEQDIQDQLVIRAEHYESVDAYIEMMTKQVGILPEELYRNIEDELLLYKIATKDIYISNDEVEAYMAEHPDDYANRYALGMKWIVVDEMQLARKLLVQLSQGEVFEQLAKQYSQDSYTAAQGGSLGLIESDDPFYALELREAALSLEVGSIAGPFELEEGVAIIKLVDKRVINYKTQEQHEDLVRQQLALEQADSLQVVLNRLLNQYGSLIKK